MKTHKDFGWLFWLHLILIILVYASPFLLPWKITLLFIGLYYVQLMIFGSCILSMMEFNSEETQKSFFHHYLSRFGFQCNERKLFLVLDYIVPSIIIAVALFWQLGLQYHPLLTLLTRK